MAISSKAVRVFAAVEVLRDSKADVRHALATLFEPDLALFNGQVFDPSRVSAQINNQYKLGITPDVVAGFVDIFVERGWLNQVVSGDKAAFVVDCSLSTTVTDEVREFGRRATEIAVEFREFIREISPLSQINKTNEELVDDIVDWLMLLDRVTEEDLRTALASRYKVGTKIFVNYGGNDADAVSESTFLSARFVEHLFNAKSVHINFLIELGEVGLITEVVRDFQRPTSATKTSNLAVYLDAPLALDFLGMSGIVGQESVASVLTPLVGMGGSLRIFRQSIDELKANLNALLNRPISERTGPTADALRRREVYEPYVREVASTPEKFLEQAGIAVLEHNLDMFPNEFRFFTKDAVESLYSQIGWVREDAARFHDAAIAAMAMRKRMGARSADIFEVRHVVLTRNPTFPKLTRRIALEHAYIGPQHVGPVVHQRQLATAIWLRAGARSDTEIPRRHILSACRRVLTLRKNIVERVHQLKSGLSDRQAEQLELLLTVDRSAQALMDKTLGSAAIIDSSNIELLLEEMKKAQIAEHVAETKVTVSRLKDEASAREAELALAASEVEAQLALERELAEQAALDSTRQIEVRNRKLAMVTDQAIAITNRRVARVRKSAILVVGICFVLLTLAGFFGNVQNIYVTAACLFVVLVLGGAFQFSGFLRSRFVDSWFEKRDYRILQTVCGDMGLEYETTVNGLTYSGRGFDRV